MKEMFRKRKFAPKKERKVVKKVERVERHKTVNE